MFKKRDSMQLAQAELKAMYQDKKFFIEEMEFSPVRRLETRFPTLNWILSGSYFGEKAGIPLGKILLIAGMESIGKSALGFEIARSFIHADGRALWIDAEASFDPEYVRKTFNIDAQDHEIFKVAKPDYGEQSFDIMTKFSEANSVDLMVLDSIVATATKKIVENNAGDITIGELARKLSTHFPKIITSIDKNEITVVYINQLRENMITMGGMMKSAGKSIPGGNALRFYPHVILLLKEIKELWVNGDTEYFGSEIEIYADKNKTALPKKFSNLILVPGEGFSRELDILLLASQTGVVRSKASWYYFGEQAVGNGLKQCHYNLKEKPDFLEEIWTATKPLLQPESSPITDTQADEEEHEEITTSKKKNKKK